MIELPRSLARTFRAVLRHSSSPVDNQRELPVIVCRAGPNGLVLEAVRSEVAFRVSVEGSRPEESLAFPASVLARIEGRTESPATLERIDAATGRARWEEEGSPHSMEFALAAADAIPTFPEVPRRFTPMPVGFVHALAEAIRTTTRDSVRYALTRVQLRGKEGALAATDGKQLLLQAGFPMPWSEDLLVPAIPALAARERTTQEPIGIARTRSQVALRQGAWTFLLLIDKQGKFPAIETVIPKSLDSASRLRLDHADAEAIVSALSRLPSKRAECPVTLDLGTRPALRYRVEEEGPIEELPLPRSTVVGKPVRIATDCRYLLRALQLHFEEICVPGEGALCCRGEGRTYVWMPLGKESVLPPNADALRGPASNTSALRAPQPRPEPPKEGRRPIMPLPTTNGHSPNDDRRGAPPPSDRPSLEELITEAEALRTQLSDAAHRSARLVAALKQQRRHSRVLRTAIDSLRELKLGP